MSNTQEVCQQCGSVLKTDVCLHCGFDPNSRELEIDDQVSEEAKEVESSAQEEEVSKENDVLDESEDLEGQEDDHHEVRSIFADMAVERGVEQEEPVEKKRKFRFVTPVLLFLILLGLAGASYWRFIYYTPEYVSPLVLSAADIRDLGGAVESTQAASLDTENEMTIELESGLTEGNFEVGDFAQFGATNTQVFVQAFDIRNIFKKWGTLDKLDALQEEYGVTNDDLSVYFSKGVGYFVPDENLDTWGFVIGVNDQEYAEGLVETFNQRKENPNYEYADYYAQVVEVAIPKEDISADEATESAETEEEGVGEESSSEEEEAGDAESEVEPESADSEESSEESENAFDANVYLLISNSNEYLDQMEESSEGNLTNLIEEAVYAQSRVDLPKIGEVFVFKEKDTPVWDTLADRAASKYEDFTGLDRILKMIESTGSAFFTVDSKLRIVMSEN